MDGRRRPQSTGRARSILALCNFGRKTRTFASMMFYQDGSLASKRTGTMMGLGWAWSQSPTHDKLRRVRLDRFLWVFPARISHLLGHLRHILEKIGGRGELSRAFLGTVQLRGVLRVTEQRVGWLIEPIPHSACRIPRWGSVIGGSRFLMVLRFAGMFRAVLARKAESFVVGVHCARIASVHDITHYLPFLMIFLEGDRETTA